MKKILGFLLLSFALTLSGCGAKDEVEKSKIEVKENGVYSAPSNPTDAQVKLFNKLAKAISAQDEEKIVSLVAQNFAFDFFSLKNKESAQDVGGLTYLPADRQEDFKTFAMSIVYSNYASIKKDNGAKHLPLVKKVTLNSLEVSSIDYNTVIPANAETGDVEQTVENTYDGWNVALSLEYDSSDVSDSFKKDVTLSLINIDGRICIVSLV